MAVNKRVDGKSYTSLHKLVDDMFPPQWNTEQVCRLIFSLTYVSTFSVLETGHYLSLLGLVL